MVLIFLRLLRSGFCEESARRARILRSSLILRNYSYTLEHQINNRMRHIDALSRAHSVMILTENTFEKNLTLLENKDPEISKFREKLESTESPFYELRDELIYRKLDSKLLFHVPRSM